MSEGIFEAYAAFSKTPYGQKLSGSIRYEKYNLSGMTNEAWVKLLGADVNNLTHMPLTYGLTKDFIKTTEGLTPGTLSDEEEKLLMLAALIHDQGEAITGDISYGDKTESDEAEELQTLIDNADAFSGEISSELRGLIAQARDGVVFNKESRLGRMFNAIERVGYLRTALRANNQIKDSGAEDYVDGLRWLTADVLSNQPLALLGYAQEYPAVMAYLTNKRDEITDAFVGITPNVFENYGEKTDTKLQEFVTSFTHWMDWLRQQRVGTSAAN